MIGLGYGLGYAKIKGDLYITDSYAKSNLDEDCHDYLLNNKSHENISQYCERVKLEKEGAQVAWSPHFTIQGENIGFEFTWINMNLISISPECVCLEENQHSLAVELEKHGIESVMLPTRHQRTLGGGFHCVTLDMEREC